MTRKPTTAAYANPTEGPHHNPYSATNHAVAQHHAETGTTNASHPYDQNPNAQDATQQPKEEFVSAQSSPTPEPYYPNAAEWETVEKDVHVEAQPGPSTVGSNPYVAIGKDGRDETCAASSTVRGAVHTDVISNHVDTSKYTEEAAGKGGVVVYEVATVKEGETVVERETVKEVEAVKVVEIVKEIETVKNTDGVKEYVWTPSAPRPDYTNTAYNCLPSTHIYSSVARTSQFKPAPATDFVTASVPVSVTVTKSVTVTETVSTEAAGTPNVPTPGANLTIAEASTSPSVAAPAASTPTIPAIQPPKPIPTPSPFPTRSNLPPLRRKKSNLQPAVCPLVEVDPKPVSTRENSELGKQVVVAEEEEVEVEEGRIFPRSGAEWWAFGVAVVRACGCRWGVSKEEEEREGEEGREGKGKGRARE